jgi:hypothetical protein
MSFLHQISIAYSLGSFAVQAAAMPARFDGKYLASGMT